MRLHSFLKSLTDAEGHVDTLFVIIEYIGVVAFTVSGAMVAIHREADLFGVVFLSVMTAFCGGILRDLCLGITPPSFFSWQSAPKVAVSITVALTVFVLALIFKRAYVANEVRIDRINNVFDALGLGIFAVLGTDMAIEAGYTAPLIAILMGLVSGIGGGMLRDLFLGTVPFVIRKRVYAVATLLGSATYYVLETYLSLGAYAMLIGVALTFALRMCATIFKWNMPKAINFSDMAQ